MTLIKWNNPRNIERVNPFAPSFNEFFENMFNGNLPTENALKVPAVNVSETETSYTVELAAPGLTKEDFKIDLEKIRLRFQLKKKLNKKKKAKTIIVKSLVFQALNVHSPCLKP